MKALFASTRMQQLATAGIGALAAAMPVAAHAQAVDATPAQEEAQQQADATAGGEITEESGIIVTGSRIAGGFTAPTPVTSLGSEALEARAPAAIAEVINELPAFRNSNSPSTAQRTPGGAGANVLDLRGLGALRTLVLLDNRRLVPTSASNTIDTNLIPSGLIERVEVVTGGASAAYGSDAVSGVVNLILKDRLEGLEGSAHAGISQRGDNAEYSLNLAYGTALGENVHLIAGLDLVQNDGVDNQYSREWGAREDGLLSLTGARAAGVPAQVFASGVRFAHASPGGLVTSGPLRGLNFLPNGQLDQFNFGTVTAGNQTTGTDDNYGFGFNSFQNLRTPIQRGSGLVRLNFDVAEETTLFLEGAYGFLKADSEGADVYIRNFTILRDNPYLPESVRAQMVANGLTSLTLSRGFAEVGGNKPRHRTDIWRVAGGAKGKLGNDWNWDAYVQYGKSRFAYNVGDQFLVPNLLASAYAVRNADGSVGCGPLATNPMLNATQRAQVQSGCVPINLFGQGSPSAAALDYVLMNELVPIDSDQLNGGVNLSGALFDLPAGAVSFAVGGEYRRQTATVTASPFAGQFSIGNLQSFAGETDVVEGYAELTVPLLRDTPFFQTLDLNGAVRYAHYSASGGATTWKIGGVWEPADFLRIRATRSRDLRAPNIGELFNAGFTATANIRNPTNGQSGIVATPNIGNIDLRPEIADTFTVGAAFTPSGFLSGFRVSVDYYDIRIDDVIQSVGGQTAVDNCYIRNLAQFCGAVTTDASPLGISAVRSTFYNINQLRTTGFDIEAQYRFNLESAGIPGAFSIRALATNVRELSTRDPAGLVDRAGNTVPKWTYNVLLNYSNAGLSTYLQLNGFSNLIYNPLLVGPEDEGYSASLSNSISSNRFPAGAYLNFGISYDVLPEAERRLELFANINNLLDKDPPFAVLYTPAQVYDYVGRSFKFGARFAF